ALQCSSATTTRFPYTTLVRSFEQGLTQAAAQLEQAQQELDRRAQELAVGKQQLAAAERKLAQGEKELAAGKAKLAESRQEGEAKDRKSTRLNSSHVKSSYAVV